MKLHTSIQSCRGETVTLGSVPVAFDAQGNGELADDHPRAAEVRQHLQGMPGFSISKPTPAAPVALVSAPPPAPSPPVLSHGANDEGAPPVPKKSKKKQRRQQDAGTEEPESGGSVDEGLDEHEDDDAPPPSDP